MKKRVIAILLCVVMVSSLFAGCGKKDSEDKGAAKNEPTTTNESSDGKSSDGKSSDGKSSDSSEAPAKTEIKEFTAFFDREGIELNEDNVVKQLIAEKIGAKCKETWLTGQTAEEAVGMLIAGGEYPDFMNWSPELQDAGATVAIDTYFDQFPNIKNFWSESQWNTLRQADGHIYSMPQFGKINEKLMDTTHSGEAFWIQTRVLKWANYPEVESLDQLFQLLGDYYAANPTMADGTPIIPFEILAYDWRYFCLENPPQFLDGYPNNGRCIVDPDTFLVSDYNVTPTAVRYFKKLNEEYNKGIIDQEFVTMNHDQFMEKISTGRVLCFVEQRWDYATAEDAIKAQGLEGCTYVPLGITIDPGMNEMYYAANEAAVLTGGLCITTSCKDVEGALKFVNDLLSPEVVTLRSWGQKDVDYLVDENGLFYRTPEMRANVVKSEYKASNLCGYGYFPNFTGMNPDGINAMSPDTQPSEFFTSLAPEVQECLTAYDAETFVDMLDYNEIDGYEEPWYPMWSFTNTITTDTPGGLAWKKMEDVKMQHLPQVVIAEDFDAAWAEYMEAYKSAKPENFFAEMQEAVYARIELVQGKNVRP